VTATIGREPELKKTIRCHLTVEFDPATVNESAVKARVDEALTNMLYGVDDWNVRWVSELSEQPLFGAATRKEGA